MTIHLFTPPAAAARRRVEAVQLQQLDRAIDARRREETLRQIREAIRPGVLRSRRRHALRRSLSRAWAVANGSASR